MPAMSLNHYTILARDLDATKNFYTDIVGLTVGDRPPLGFPRSEEHTSELQSP